jgi:hypothetical protein
MRWLRDSRVFGIALILLAMLVYVIVMGWGCPLLWPHRGHPLVRVLLAFLSGGHLEGLFQEAGIWL